MILGTKFGDHASREKLEAFLLRSMEGGLISDGVLAQDMNQALSFWRIREVLQLYIVLFDRNSLFITIWNLSHVGHIFKTIIWWLEFMNSYKMVLSLLCSYLPVTSSINIYCCTNLRSYDLIVRIYDKLGIGPWLRPLETINLSSIY